MTQIDVQTEQVRAHLMRRGEITDLQALKRYAIRRLADCIYRLRGRSKIRKYRKTAIRIYTDIVDGKNRFGKKVRYAIYRYQEESVQ
jgi:hypothetical protein